MNIYMILSLNVFKRNVEADHAEIFMDKPF